MLFFRHLVSRLLEGVGRFGRNSPFLRIRAQVLTEIQCGLAGLACLVRSNSSRALAFNLGILLPIQQTVYQQLYGPHLLGVRWQT